MNVFNIIYKKLFIVMLFLILLSTSCDVLKCEAVKVANGESGYIDGKIVLLPNNYIGISGVIYPTGILFPIKTAVKYTLTQEHSDYLHNNYNCLDGDNIYFWFVYISVADGDWNTIISIGTDLEISSEKK